MYEFSKNAKCFLLTIEISKNLTFNNNKYHNSRFHLWKYTVLQVINKMPFSMCLSQERVLGKMHFCFKTLNWIPAASGRL